LGWKDRKRMRGFTESWKISQVNPCLCPFGKIFVWSDLQLPELDFLL